MTPAIHSAKQAGIVFQLHEYPHDAAVASYGLEAAEKLGVAADLNADDRPCAYPDPIQQGSGKRFLVWCFTLSVCWAD